VSEGAPSGFSGSHCGHCGELAAVGDHAGCATALALEPPRYCTNCRRRLVVQVVPYGWTARCSRHGDVSP
jgi:hypothetical protein